MHGGRGAGRVLVAVALVALPLTGFAVLVAGSPPDTPAPHDVVLRLLPGTAGDAHAARPASEGVLGARGTPAARQLGLLAALLGTVAVVALAAAGAAPCGAAAVAPAGRLLPATGRGPPHLPR